MQKAKEVSWVVVEDHFYQRRLTLMQTLATWTEEWQHVQTDAGPILGHRAGSISLDRICCGFYSKGRRAGITIVRACCGLKNCRRRSACLLLRAKEFEPHLYDRHQCDAINRRRRQVVMMRKTGLDRQQNSPMTDRVSGGIMGVVSQVLQPPRSRSFSLR